MKILAKKINSPFYRKLLNTAFVVVSFLVIFNNSILAEASTSASSASTESSAAAGVLWVFMMIFMCFFYLLILLIPLALLGGLIWNLFLVFDATKRDFPDENQLILWVLILVLVGFPIGTVLYHVMVINKVPMKA